MRRIAGLVFILLLGYTALAQSIHGRDGITLPPPPAAEPNPVIDNYFGTKITDNYRWLEDAKSPETRAFIDAAERLHRALSQADSHPPQVLDDLDAARARLPLDHPHPARRQLLLQKRLAGEEQASIYMRRGWTGAAPKAPKPQLAKRRTPHRSRRHSAAIPTPLLRLADVSRDGTLLAYQVRQGGADEATVRVYSVQTKKPLEDELPAGIYYSISFTPDGKGVYYARTDRKGTLLYLHVLGTRTDSRQAHLRPRIPWRTARPHRPLSR